MKFKAVALLFLFAFTIFNPIVGKENETDAKHSCCKAISKSSSDIPFSSDNQDKKDCCNNGCNPFMNCCGMMGFVVVDPIQIGSIQLNSKKENIDTYQSIQSNHEQVIWQPPRV